VAECRAGDFRGPTSPPVIGGMKPSMRWRVEAIGLGNLGHGPGAPRRVLDWPPKTGPLKPAPIAGGGRPRPLPPFFRADVLVAESHGRSRSPRGQETCGGDPYRTSPRAVPSLSRGALGRRSTLKVMVTPKHFEVHRGPKVRSARKPGFSSRSAPRRGLRGGIRARAADIPKNAVRIRCGGPASLRNRDGSKAHRKLERGRGRIAGAAQGIGRRLSRAGLPPRERLFHTIDGDGVPA
jgi:hypothetical protein